MPPISEGNAARVQDPLGQIAKLSNWDVERLSVIAQREAGISLGQDKADFLQSRLARRLAKTGLSSFKDYCDYLDRPEGKAEIRVFVESIATHTTSFFRESTQFDWLGTTGLDMLWDGGAGQTRDLVTWSAACSIGSELYTALMVLHSAGTKRFGRIRCKGIGTDLSRQVVRVAENAVYSRQEIDGIHPDLRPDYLLSSKSGADRYRIAPVLRHLTEWRVANLTDRAMLSGIEADVVFLRNVLIYFDADTQQQVLQNVLGRLRPGGFLMIGHSETGTLRDLGLTTVRPTVYQKRVS